MSVMIHFRNVFQGLEYLLRLDADENTVLWALHAFCMSVINKRIDKFKEHCDHHPLSTVGSKSTQIICLARSLNNQAINSKMCPETMHYYSEWQRMPPISEHGSILNPPFEIELSIY